MGSSFLTVLHSGLALFAGLAFFKLIIQYGRPNHPLKVISYLTTFAVFLLILGDPLADLGFISAWDWIKWQTLPLMASCFGLIFEIIMVLGGFNQLQQKIMTRLPLLAALLGYTFLKEHLQIIIPVTLILCLFLLIFSTKNLAFFRRVFIKMTIMLGLSSLLLNYGAWNFQWLRAILLYFSFFYFYLYQQGLAAISLVDSFHNDQMEETK
jgi:hypothetical protein